MFDIGAGKPVFVYNVLDLKRTIWSGRALGAGTHTIVFEFKSDGPGLGKGGAARRQSNASQRTGASP